MGPERNPRLLYAAVAAALILSGATLLASMFGWRALTILFAVLAMLSAVLALAAAWPRTRYPRAVADSSPRATSAVLDSVPSPALLVNEKGVILEVNRLAREFITAIGREPSSLQGTRLDEAFLPPYFANWTPLLEEVGANEKPLDRSNEQYFLESKSGFCRVWISLFEPDAGGARRFLVMVQDITPEVSEHAALLEASEREAGVFEGVPVKIAVLDRNFRLARCNRLMMHWIHDTCGLQESELVGLPALDIMPQEFRADWKRILRRVLVEGRAFEQPRVHQAVEGTDYFHRVRLHPLTDESGNVREALLLYEDVTEYVRLERRLAETTDGG